MPYRRQFMKRSKSESITDPVLCLSCQIVSITFALRLKGQEDIFLSALRKLLFFMFIFRIFLRGFRDNIRLFQDMGLMVTKNLQSRRRRETGNQWVTPSVWGFRRRARIEERHQFSWPGRLTRTFSHDILDITQQNCFLLQFRRGGLNALAFLQ